MSYRSEERKKMSEAIRRLKLEEPEKHAELLTRAQDAEYDRLSLYKREAEKRLELDEARRLTELERVRGLVFPVVSGLPDVPRVRGIVAFRVWHCDDLGLRSTSLHHHWKALNFADRVPERSNHSGFYCIKLTGLGVLTSGVGYFGIGRQSASGFVELRGKIVEHTDGVMRAEIAKLMCLFVTSENELLVDTVRTLYKLYPTTPVYVLNPEQLADVVMREVLRQRYLGGSL